MTTENKVFGEICSSFIKRTFTLQEAHELLPLIYRITDDVHGRVKKMIQRIEALQGSNPILVTEIESEINAELNKWQNKITRLGAVPKGMWLADFDNGQGYYCWKFPETQIRYFHGYQDGFSGRVEIEKFQQVTTEV